MANPSMTSRLVAANIRREMKLRGLTQTQLANICGLTQARIAEILRPKSDLQLATVEKMANGLGKTVTELIDGPALVPS